jgi:hypothetical protein
MPNRIYVKVSEDHIRNGIQEDSCACPVALALAEMRVAWRLAIRSMTVRTSSSGSYEISMRMD